MKKYRIVMTVLLVAMVAFLGATQLSTDAPAPVPASSGWSNSDIQGLKIN